MDRLLLAAALVLLLEGSATAQPAVRCSRETLSVRGAPLTASYCVSGNATAGPGHDLPVAVDETYSTPQGTLSRSRTLRFIAGEEASRVIEDVPLGQLGMTGTLHVTLVLRAGRVLLEGAMLTPGAVTIK